MRVRGPVVALAFLATGAASAQAPAAGWEDDFFARGVLGEWKGTGTIEGEEVELTRIWRLDLAGHFLRVDMSQLAPDGASFRALGYWNRTGENDYRLVWMDEHGEQRYLVAYGDPRERSVVTHYHHRRFGGSPLLRRLTFHIEGPLRYREQVEERRGDRWEVIADFRFTRALH